MPIVIKIAKTAQELKDVYQLRYQVYKDEGSFEENNSGMVCDHFDDFDALPNSKSVIAYAGG